jgi:multidrug efflux pump subunit AcrA (membrane-fusion protein)
MLRYSHFSLFFAIFVLATGGLVSLNLTSTLIWADSTHVHDDSTSHPHSQENIVTLTDKAKTNIGLRTAEVDLRAIETIVHVHGNILAHPKRQAIVTPRIGGIVKRIHSSVGEFVEKGDLLLELESLDLQMAQIEMIEAVAQKKSLESKLARLTEVFAKQIRRELQTRQIDYLQSLSELQELQTAIEKRKVLAITKAISVLEQMRFRLVKADVELQLLRTTLKRTEALAEKRISAQKELIAQQAEYRKRQSELAGAKRQFQILDVSEQTLEKILHDSGETAILSLLNADELDAEALLEKYAMLSGEGTELVNAEATYKIAAIKVAANKQRALAAGLTETLLENLAKTKAIVSFNDLPTDELIENYLAFVESSEALEGVLQLEEALRSASITLNKVRQQLQVSGLTLADIDKVVQTGQPVPIFYVTAPASGQIIKQHVTLGTTVEKSNMLFSILDNDLVWVEGEVHEDSLVRLHDKWQIGSEVRARVAAYPETIFTGRISHISGIMNPEERTVHFWAEVNNPTHKLKPGMFAEQTIVLEKGAEVLSVPLNAVLEDGGSRFVFVELEETYTKQEVVVGAKDDQYIEIKEGLFPEEYVVVQGQHQLLRATAKAPEAMDAHGHPH